VIDGRKRANGGGHKWLGSVAFDVGQRALFDALSLRWPISGRWRDGTGPHTSSTRNQIHFANANRSRRPTRRRRCDRRDEVGGRPLRRLAVTPPRLMTSHDVTPPRLMPSLTAAYATDPAAEPWRHRCYLCTSL